MVKAPGLFFNHVPKTGGMTFYRALRKILPQGSLSPHFNPQHGHDSREWNRFDHVAGHFGCWHQSNIDFHTRLTVVCIREPIAHAVSCYCYWRFVIPDDKWPGLDYVQQAKTLHFSDFIRGCEIVWNMQSRFLAGIVTNDPELFAERVLSCYQIVGVTEQLGKVFAKVLDELGIYADPAVLTRNRVNASPTGRISINEDDQCFILRKSDYDLALYRLARERALN